jgi:hypothetical protein
MISEEYVSNFQQAYKDITGRDIPREEAYEKGMRFIRMIRAVYGIPESESNELSADKKLDRR